MLRYISYILIVLTAIGLTAAIGVILVGGLFHRLSHRGAMTVTAFDAVATPASGTPRLHAILLEADSGQAVSLVKLFFRLEDGWSNYGWTSSDGTTLVYVPNRGAGRYAFTVSLSEMEPCLGVRSGAALWIRPDDAPVVWLDAMAVVESPSASSWVPPDPKQAAAYDPLDALKTLAAGRQVVYLVAAPVADYQGVRLHLDRPGIPPGPAFWIKPGGETERLSALRTVWPRVDAAIVCTPALQAAAERCKAPTWRVRYARGARAQPFDGISEWRDVLGRVTPGRGTSDTGEK